MTKYVVELTDIQLKLISEACEICARMKCGQIGRALSMLELKNTDDEIISNYDFGKLIETIIKPIMNLGYDSYWGVGYSEKSDAWFDINETIRHRLVWDNAYDRGIIKPGESRKWPEMMTVDYDEPMHWGAEPIPTIIKMDKT